MIKSLSNEEKQKFSNLICNMVQLISDLKIGRADEALIYEYVEHVSRIDDKNPMKNLLLLKRKALDLNIVFRPEASAYLLNYNIPLEEIPE